MNDTELENIKKNQERYFKLITSGHCAICLKELNVPKEALEVLDSATCSECHKHGLDKIFMMGVMCGRELKEWKKARSESTNQERYYVDEDGVLRGNCPKHGEFIGDAIGCPKCFAESEEAEAKEEDQDRLEIKHDERVGA